MLSILTKSKYCDGIICNKKLWLKTYKPYVESDVNNDSILETGREVGELAHGLFGDYHSIEFNNDLNIMVNDTKSAVYEVYNIIIEASFLYEDNFCSIDILRMVNFMYSMIRISYFIIKMD